MPSSSVPFVSCGGNGRAEPTVARSNRATAADAANLSLIPLLLCRSGLRCPAGNSIHNSESLQGLHRFQPEGNRTPPRYPKATLGSRSDERVNSGSDRGCVPEPVPAPLDYGDDRLRIHTALRGGTQRRRLTRSGGLKIYGNPTGDISHASNFRSACAASSRIECTTKAKKVASAAAAK